MKTIFTSIANLAFDEIENILHIEIHDSAEMNLQNTIDHYKRINELVGDKKYLALVDAKNFYTVEKQAWEYASSIKVVQNRVAVAHYNSSFANKLTTSCFKSAYKSSMPLEIFSTKEEAINWLRTFSDKCV